MSTDKKIGVVFDLDGVLVDTSKFHKPAWKKLAEKEALEISDDFFYSTFGMQNYQIIAKLIGRQPTSEEIQRISEFKECCFRELAADNIELMDGVQSLLEELKSKGFLLAIGTSTPLENLTFILEQTGIDNYFNAYVTAEDVKMGKPAPDTFKKAAEKLSLPAGRCVVIEDAIQGIEAAKTAGMPVVAVSNTRKQKDLKRADLTVDSLAGLKADDFIRLLDNSG
ncbi:HAD family hydrolase [Planctomycetota bacterium]